MARIKVRGLESFSSFYESDGFGCIEAAHHSTRARVKQTITRRPSRSSYRQVARYEPEDSRTSPVAHRSISVPGIRSLDSRISADVCSLDNRS